jgi:hypothetical protein
MASDLVWAFVFDLFASLGSTQAPLAADEP